MHYKYMDNFIKIYDNALDHSICEEIITKFETDDRKKPGVNLSGNVTNSKITTDLPLNITGWENYDTILSKCVSKYLNEYLSEFSDYFKAVKALGDSGYLMMKYNANVGHFNYHADVNGLNSAKRMLACLWYLNDVEIGGETHFKNYDFSIIPKQGRFAIFPANFTHLHQGNIAQSDKYVINTFITYSA